MKLLRFFSVILALLIMVACSSRKKNTAVTIDDIREVEATAEAALSLARLDSLRIASALFQLDFISRQIDLMDSTFSIMPVAKIDENQLQIALLREEVAFLRRFLENQNQVPLVNPSREQAPNVPSGLPAEYEQAQYLFLHKNYEAAAKAFEGVTVLYPKSKWASDAWYWVGESQMALGNYSQAISAFEKVFFYRDSIKHADAQFQIGVCLQKVGNAEAARAVFRKVQEFYPKSPRALQAQSELKKMN
jgi:tol-pal system protein YbgF